MKPFSGILILSLTAALSATAQNNSIWISRNADISLFSSAPIENIDAKSTQGVSAINPRTRDVYFKVLITTFQFRNSLMQEHFNEDFMESDKYPYAEFRGKIQDSTDLEKDGTYSVTVKGTLSIHNVSKVYTVQGKIDVSGGKITVHSRFDVRLADHHITIPKLVVQNIAEVIQVTIDASYTASPG
ncbi:MAG TPA: YceI family protein [Chitinophagaceae bacterium]|nr:YceI family protein [Chitinophagaceae bacterium]